MCYAPIENFFLVLARPRVILNACERLHVNQSMYDMYNLDGVFIIAGPTGILISACWASSLAKVFRCAKLPEFGITGSQGFLVRYASQIRGAKWTEKPWLVKMYVGLHFTLYQMLTVTQKGIGYCILKITLIFCLHIIKYGS